MKKTFFYSLFLVCFFLFSLSISAGNVYVISIKGDIINPVIDKFISRAIDKAEVDNVSCIIIELDTPGGLLESTRNIVMKIVNSKIPVIVYVSPSGGRATSAGVFITCSAHIAAMAPTTHIGAAHPVNIAMPNMEQMQKPLEKKDSAKEGSSEQKDIMSDKIMKDTIAWITSIAKLRNRNLQWIQESVEKNNSITEDEALKIGVINFIANDFEDLLRKLDGQSVIINEKPFLIDTKNPNIIRVLLSPAEKFLNVISNPNIAYILMMLGMLGLIFEFTHPGVGFPGVAGIICLILSFFAFDTLPVNYAGIALVLLALILFVSEAFTPTFGFLTLAGVISLIVGSVMLFDSGYPFFKVSLYIIIGMACLFSFITLFLVSRIIKVYRRPVKSGLETFIGRICTATTQIQTEGKVFINGEIWNARSEDNTIIPKESKVKIIAVQEGLVLVVNKVE